MESLEVNPQAQDQSKKAPVYNAMSWYLNAPKSKIICKAKRKKKFQQSPNSHQKVPVKRSWHVYCLSTYKSQCCYIYTFLKSMYRLMSIYRFINSRNNLLRMQSFLFLPRFMCIQLYTNTTSFNSIFLGCIYNTTDLSFWDVW